MAGEAVASLGLCCCGTVVVILWLSFTSLAPTQIALRYNWILKTVDPQVDMDAGFKFVGPFTSLLKYPKTIQTLDFQAFGEVLDGRTQDGLPLTLGIAFQYRLLPDGLFKLYHSYESYQGNYEAIYRLIATHMVTEIATQFTAYQFFNEKQRIAEVMRMRLDEYFSKNLYASVDSLQINEDDLPAAFTETILTAATSKQNITKMGKTLDAQRVNFRTAVLVSEAQANQTINQAIGDQHKILQNGHADAAIIEAYVEAEREAYTKVKDALALQGDSLLNYIWYDTLGGGGVSANSQQSQDIQMLVGVNPAAYISDEL